MKTLKYEEVLRNEYPDLADAAAHRVRNETKSIDALLTRYLRRWNVTCTPSVRKCMKRSNLGEMTQAGTPS
jgi:hypothetical protein